MNEAIVKEEVIEETNNFTYINGEYVEVKQEEIEQRPEYLLENEIKTEMNDDCFETNEPDEYFEDVKQEPGEIGSKIEKLSPEFSLLKCGICKKRMPKNLLKLIKSEEDKTVLSVFFFKIEGSLKIKSPYVCYAHIQTIIDTNGSKLKSPSTRYEQILRSFMTKNKRRMQVNKKSINLLFEIFRARHNCQVCHMLKNRCELYQICSKGIRMVIMIGRILRGTHSVEQAKNYINNTDGLTCYSHCKRSIDKILEHLGAVCVSRKKISRNDHFREISR
ncbi:hypothetical protein B9Z55_021063 [Caenorhabditis nigoni]|uniref:Lin-15A/B-like domain-containing protein n=1 Tax=Caenorhabditis nigoni TaxID=1611254 RepID=A0A2G5TQJ7_9PELO|nr:hypothetical protein B9Z55_021063 [Caenorhabditis nigoni]